jgi:hypothetical protein
MVVADHPTLVARAEVTSPGHLNAGYSGAEVSSGALARNLLN